MRPCAWIIAYRKGDGEWGTEAIEVTARNKRELDEKIGKKVRELMARGWVVLEVEFPER